MNDEQRKMGEIFTSLDKDRILAYWKTKNTEIPDNEEEFWAVVHKVICKLFLIDDTSIECKQFNTSFDWLVEHGYTPIEDDEDDYEQEKEVENEDGKSLNEDMNDTEKCEEGILRKRLSNEEKLNLMIEYINENGKEINIETRYKGFNIGYFKNNLRQMYYKGILDIDDDLLDQCIKLGIISEKKERIRTSQQEKYEFLISLADKKEKQREKAKMKNGLTYSEVKRQLQIDYNGNNIKLTDEQINNLRNTNMLEYSKEETKKLEDSYQLPKKYVLDIMKKYESVEEFKKAYKKCQYNYDFKNDIFCGFRGIAISKNDITEYQKLQYALAIKDILSMDLSQFEYNTGKYIDIDEFDNMIMTLSKTEGKVYRCYTILDGKKYTLVEIGKMLGLSAERARQIIKKAERRLKHPSRTKHILRDYQSDFKEIDEYNKKIEEIKSDMENLQIIINYLSDNQYNNENIELHKLNLNEEKLDKLRKEKIFYIHDLIKKCYEKTSTSFKDICIRELDLSARTENALHFGGKKETLYDLINSTELDLLRIRTLGKSSYNEIINRLSDMGLTLKREVGANKKIEESSIFDFYDKKGIIGIFIFDQKYKSEQLKEFFNNKEETKSRVIRYYNAVQQYLNHEDIFNNEYNVKAITINQQDLENYDNVKNYLEGLKIISDNNIIKNKKKKAKQ